MTWDLEKLSKLLCFWKVSSILNKFARYSSSFLRLWKFTGKRSCWNGQQMTTWIRARKKRSNWILCNLMIKKSRIDMLRWRVWGRTVEFWLLAMGWSPLKGLIWLICAMTSLSLMKDTKSKTRQLNSEKISPVLESKGVDSS